MTGLVSAAALQPHSLLISCSSSSCSPTPGCGSSVSSIFVRHPSILTGTLIAPTRCWNYWTSCSRDPVVSGIFVESPSGSLIEEEEEDEDLALYEEELELEDEKDEEDEQRKQELLSGIARVKRTFRLLGNKEKKELRGYAHSLGNDICVHQVGKWGVTANCITAISDALEANELIKVRVLDNLDEELDDTVLQLEMRTGAQIVGRIGRTLLLYRPSIRKLKAAQDAEEKAFKNQKRRGSTTSSRWQSKSNPGAVRGRR